jgi:O-antigen/teichoic acid export membrane protein
MISFRPEARQTFVLMVGGGATALLGLIYGLYATRTLDAGAVGEFTHALAIVAFLQISLGPINGTVAKFTAEYAAQGATGRIRSLVAEVTRRVAGYGLIPLLIAVVLAFPLASFWKYQSPVPIVVAFAITYTALVLSVSRGALRGLQAFGQYNVNIIFESGLRLVIGAVLLAFWIGSTAGLLPYLVALGATLLLSHWQLNRKWANVPSEPVDGRAVRGFVGPMFLLMLAYAGFQNMDMLFAKRVFASELADAYGVAFYLTGRAVDAMVTPFHTLMLPLLANLHGAGKPLTATFLRICCYFLGLAILPLLLFALWPEPLVRLVYGDRFLEAVPILFPLTAVRVIGHLCHLVGLAGAAAGRFAFLIIYIAGLLAQFVAMLFWHQSPPMIVKTMVVVQSATLVCMAVQFLIMARGSRRPPS